MIDLYKFYNISHIHGVDVYGILKSQFIKEYGYTALYSNRGDVNLILSAKEQCISVIRTLTSRLNQLYPDRDYRVVPGSIVVDLRPDRSSATGFIGEIRVLYSYKILNGRREERFYVLHYTSEGKRAGWE